MDCSRGQDAARQGDSAGTEVARCGSFCPRCAGPPRVRQCERRFCNGWWCRVTNSVRRSRARGCGSTRPISTAGKRRNWGSTFLESWIAQDTIAHTHDQAHAHAENFAAQMAAAAAKYPQYYKTPVKNDYRSAYNQRSLNRSAPPMVRRASLPSPPRVAVEAQPLRRAVSQNVLRLPRPSCKALIRMLSWIEQPLDDPGSAVGSQPIPHGRHPARRPNFRD